MALDVYKQVVTDFYDIDKVLQRPRAPAVLQVGDKGRAIGTCKGNMLRVNGDVEPRVAGMQGKGRWHARKPLFNQGTGEHDPFAIDSCAVAPKDFSRKIILKHNTNICHNFERVFVYLFYVIITDYMVPVHSRLLSLGQEELRAHFDYG
jgi:hypothetical protein